MIEIDNRSPVPTYEQILRQLRAAIAANKLGTGDPLPPIRQLASDLEINPATVAKAYQILEKDGIIQTAGRKGTFVHPNALANLKESTQKEAAEQVRMLIAHWEQRGLTARELKDIFNRTIQFQKDKETK